MILMIRWSSRIYLYYFIIEKDILERKHFKRERKKLLTYLLCKIIWLESFLIYYKIVFQEKSEFYSFYFQRSL